MWLHGLGFLFIPMETNEKGQFVRNNLAGFKTAGCLKVSETWEKTPNGGTRWLTHCEVTGEPIWVWAESLKRGSTIWCKTCRKKAISKARTTHGHAGIIKSETYRCWQAVRNRCTNPAERCYYLYGGRGIKMCKRWYESFENFLADMGEKPPGLTLERINTDGNYSCGHCPECLENNWPSNCKWATWQEQANNRRTNVLIPFNGKTQTISQWSRELGIDKTTIRKRLLAGEPPERILSKISLRRLTT